jgi:hypothetical protein
MARQSQNTTPERVDGRLDLWADVWLINICKKVERNI